MEEAYLKRVVVYLQQELPDYKDMVAVENGQLVFIVPMDSAFEAFYQTLLASVSASVARIRNRETDLEFKVCSPSQERDFKVLK